MVGGLVDEIALRVSRKNSWVSSDEYEKRQGDGIWGTQYLSALALSLGERFWLFRPEELLSGVDEGLLDWVLTDLGLSDSATGNLITSWRTTG